MKDDAKLAQWYLERGMDQMGTAFGLFLGGVILLPLAIVLLPAALWEFVSGYKKRRQGRAMNQRLDLPDTERSESFWTAWDGYGDRQHRAPWKLGKREGVPAQPPVS